MEYKSPITGKNSYDPTITPKKKGKKGSDNDPKNNTVLTISILTFFITLGVIIGVFMAYTQEVPEVVDLKNYKPNLSTAIYDLNNNLVSQLYTEQRTIIKLSQVPMELQNAMIAKEDPNFYHHNGFDIRGIMRSTVNNIIHMKIVEGASTITMQLANNLFLTREKTFTRKIKQLLLALQIEKYYTKAEILEMYCNQIYFGSGAHGVEAAARTYFGKHVEDLTLPECAMLAALPQAPSAYSPYRNISLAKEKRDLVLSIMANRKVITPEERDIAIEMPIELSKLEVKNAPYFVEYVRQNLEETYGTSIIYKGGLRVYTTIDSEIQNTAQEVFNRNIQKLQKRIERFKGKELEKPLQGALLAMDPNTGHIKAMIGGIDFSKSEFNRAVQSKRQTGSAFKPIVYTAAIDSGFRVCDIILDSPIVFTNNDGTSWKPENFNGKFLGPMIVLNGLTYSKNVVTVRLLNKVGISTVKKYARKMGITSPLVKDLTLGLGSSSLSLFEMVNAFCTLANGGMKVKPMSVLIVKDSNGKILEQHKPKLTESIPESTAYIVTYMMENVVNRGTGRAIRRLGFKGPVAGKTGTTNNFTDAWFMGFTPDLVVGIWVGLDSRESMGRIIVGGSAAAPIWGEFMLKTFGSSKGSFPVPDNIIFKKICTKSGGLATQHCRRTSLDAPFVEGTEPTKYCTVHSGMETDSLLENDFENYDDDGSTNKKKPTPQSVLTPVLSTDDMLNF